MRWFPRLFSTRRALSPTTTAASTFSRTAASAGAFLLYSIATRPATTLSTTTRTFRTAAPVLLLYSVAARSASAFTPAFLSHQNLSGSTMASATSCRASSTQSDARATTTPTKFLKDVEDALTNSWPRMLSDETKENLALSRMHSSLNREDRNQTQRPVYNGHYVLVEPTPLAKPVRLVLYSKDVAHQLQLNQDQVDSDEFVEWMSGNRNLAESWATPYALSIMGTQYTNNCPYGTGDGYGDGRAISIGELHGFELQLKGAGQTPFCRGADGRAVLRSSIREFLASEAMHHLGVSTTRALSLVVSEKEAVRRPWYSPESQLRIPTMDDPRLKDYPEEKRRSIIRQLRTTQKSDPNILIQEKAAITCRVAPSFVRIGHIDLFARRAEKKSIQNAKTTNKRYDTTTREWKELEEIIWHACFREFKEEAYDPYFDKGNIEKAATVLLQKSAYGISKMVAHWIRVGFAQGNFNADNCLIKGRTMDYGPFGWVEEYHPLFAKWTGSGQHFGFLNQPSAGYANYNVLVESVVPVIAAARGVEDPEPIVKEFLEPAADKFQSAVDEMFRLKLGFLADQDIGDDVWQTLEPLLLKSRTDWTLFFRQLTYVVRDFPSTDGVDYDAMMNALEGNEKERVGSSPFYEPTSGDLRRDWIAWLEQWHTAALASNDDDGKAVYERMRTANPKYVLREWMLVDAYSAAANDEEAELTNLYSLIQRPYDEGTEHEERKYYRRAPEEALTRGGVGFMS